MEFDKITLSVYLDRYIQNLKNDYQLPDEQYQFTSYPLEVLEQSRHNQEMFPVLIVSGDTAVGFFCLNNGMRVSEVTTNKKALLLTSFSINYKYQRRGYAKQALLTVPSFIKTHFEGITELVLAVNMRNTPAQTLYKAGGFEDLGKRRMGKKGEQMILHLEI